MLALVRRWSGFLAALAVLSAAGCKEVSVTAEPVASLEVDPTQVTLVVGQSSDVRAILKGTSGREVRRDVSWNTSSASVATVTGEGRITAQGPGTARITASSVGRSADVTVTVNARPVTTVEVNPPVTSLAAGDSLLFTAVAKASDGSTVPGKTAVWNSSDPGVALVRANGMVRAQAVGSATVAATIDGIRGQSDVTVRASVLTVSTVQVTPATATVGAGDTVRFQSTARASNGTLITGRRTLWSSSNPAIAEIDSTGKATGRSAGRTTITANVDGINGTATLDVGAATVASVEIVPAQSTVLVGGTVQLTAVLRSQSGNVITGPSMSWSSANALIASVNGTGLVSAHAVGGVTLTATAGGRSGFATVSVVGQPVSTINIRPIAPLVNVGDTLMLSAELRDANNVVLTGRGMSWTSVDTSVATIQATAPATQQARLIGRRVGNAVIVATSESKRDTVIARVDPRAELVVTKTAPGVVNAGDTISFTIRVRNDGPNAASLVQLRDSLPGLTVVSATGQPTQVGVIVGWTAIPLLLAGRDTVFTVRVEAPAIGPVITAAYAFSSTYERNSADNTVATSTTVSAADVAVTLSAPTSVSGSSNFDYTITVVNNGPGRATGVTTTTPIPQNATFVSATGGAVPSGGVLSFPAVATLNPGEDTVYTVTLTAPLLGNVATSAAVLSATADPVATNNSANASTTVNPVAADVEVTLTASNATVAVGDTITYTIDVKNNGPGAALTLLVSQSLGSNVQFQSATAGYVQTGSVLTWGGVGFFLVSGGSLSFTVKVTATAAGSTTATAEAVLLNDPDLTNNTRTAATTIT